MSSESDLFFLDLLSDSDSSALESEDTLTLAELSAEERLIALLPIPANTLTKDEQAASEIFQQARLVLGPTAALILVCDKACPFIKQCPLAKAKKAPEGSRCPYETNLATQKFLNWAKAIGADLDGMTEVERSAVSSLTSIDIRLMRCHAILSDANHASLMSRSVKDVDENGIPVCWEDVVHINEAEIETLENQRAKILRAFELTPEQQTKKDKAANKYNSNNLASRQSDAADRLRAVSTRPKMAPE